jgi:protein phosphatase
MSIELHLAAATHTGAVRSLNEDSIGLDAHSGFAVVADGMGGYNAGEVASRIAVTAITTELRRALDALGGGALETGTARRMLVDATEAANTAIHEAAREHVECAGMATTVVAALWHGAHVTIAHAGDSRMYRLRDARIQRLTTDHSLVQEQVSLGAITAAQARIAPHRNIVTRALGVDPRAAAEVQTLPVEHADIYLLCSDGLTEMLHDASIRDAILLSPENLDAAAERLVRGANANGGVDNISVILARTVERSRTAS